MADLNCIEVVKIRPKDGARERLMELRPDIMKQLSAAYPKGVEADLWELEDGTWVDIWRWAERADAEDAQARAEDFPAFAEWVTLVEMISLEWGEPAT